MTIGSSLHSGAVFVSRMRQATKSQSLASFVVNILGSPTWQQSSVKNKIMKTSSSHSCSFFCCCCCWLPALVWKESCLQNYFFDFKWLLINKSKVLHCTYLLHCFALFCTVTYCTVLHCYLLHCTYLLHTVPIKIKQLISSTSVSFFLLYLCHK